MPFLLFYLPQGCKSRSVRSNHKSTPDPKQDSASSVRTSKLLLSDTTFSRQRVGSQVETSMSALSSALPRCPEEKHCF